MTAHPRSIFAVALRILAALLISISFLLPWHVTAGDLLPRTWMTSTGFLALAAHARSLSKLAEGNLSLKQLASLAVILGAMLGVLYVVLVLLLTLTKVRVSSFLLRLALIGGLAVLLHFEASENPFMVIEAKAGFFMYLLGIGIGLFAEIARIESFANTSSMSN